MRIRINFNGGGPILTVEFTIINLKVTNVQEFLDLGASMNSKWALPFQQSDPVVPVKAPDVIPRAPDAARATNSAPVEEVAPARVMPEIAPEIIPEVIPEPIIIP